MGLWFIKIAIFFISSYAVAGVSVKILRRRNNTASIGDPEVITVAVISGALISAMIMFVIKRLI